MWIGGICACLLKYYLLQNPFISLILDHRLVPNKSALESTLSFIKVSWNVAPKYGYSKPGLVYNYLISRRSTQTCDIRESLRKFASKNEVNFPTLGHLTSAVSRLYDTGDTILGVVRKKKNNIDTDAARSRAREDDRRAAINRGALPTAQVATFILWRR